jgi:hypothetical protein
MLAMLLSWQAQDKQVSVNVSGCPAKLNIRVVQRSEQRLGKLVCSPRRHHHNGETTMKWIKTFAALGAISVSATAAAGGQVTAAQITALYINTAYNMVFISVNVAPTGSPSCSAYTAGPNAFVLPLTSTIATQTLALLLSARATQTPVTLAGNGLCDTYSDAESLLTIAY